MGKISPQTTSKHLDLDGIEAHYGALDGYTVGFEFPPTTRTRRHCSPGCPTTPARLATGGSCSKALW